MRYLTRFSPYRSPPEDSAEYLEWLAWRLEDRALEDVTIQPQTIPLLVRALRINASVRIRRSLQDGYTVRAYIGAAPAEFLAYTPNVLIARAAFDAALAERPGRILTLQKGIRVIVSKDQTT